MKNWHELAITSHYQTVLAVKEEVSKGGIEEAAIGRAHSQKVGKMKQR